jgi:hypothetical protein
MDLAQFHGTLFGFHPMALSVFTFLAGLHKVHPAYRMVNAGRAGRLTGGRL